MDTKPVARRHHYLPQGYLAAFTHTGLKDGQFNVLDVESGRTFRTSPVNVATKRDFNRVDIDGHSPDAIEQALSPFEANAIAAIRRVIQTRAFPSDEDWNLILNLLGLIAVRNPHLRGNFNAARERSMEIIADMLVSDRKLWETHVRKARAAGEDIDEKVTFEAVKEFVEGRKYRIEFHPAGNLRVEFKALDDLLPLLGQRSWSLLIAPDDGPEFICSDHPVTLVWKHGRRGPVGYGLKETEVFFPLGRRVGFYGTFESPLKLVVNCKPGNVATMNMRVAHHAERHVYSSLESFSMWHEGQIREVTCAPESGTKKRA